MNGNSACCNSNSYGMDDRVAATLPWLFQAAMPVVGTPLIGER